MHKDILNIFLNIQDDWLPVVYSTLWIIQSQDSLLKKRHWQRSQRGDSLARFTLPHTVHTQICRPHMAGSYIVILLSMYRLLMRETPVHNNRLTQTLPNHHTNISQQSKWKHGVRASWRVPPDKTKNLGETQQNHNWRFVAFGPCVSICSCTPLHCVILLKINLTSRFFFQNDGWLHGTDFCEMASNW